MVYLTALWLPIVLSAILVFVASTIIHMALGYHNNDFGKLPDEEDVLAAMREHKVAPGQYHFPHASSGKEMNDPAYQEKCVRGPMGFMVVLPSGSLAMGGKLVQWFVYCLFVGFMTAYVTGRTMAPGAEYLAVFRVAGTVSILAYAAAHIPSSIWYGYSWSSTLKNVFDGVVYGLLTAGAFGWLWPD